MEDIAPKLYEKIEKAFTGKVNRNMDIRAFKEKLRNSQAKPEDVSLYARALGECASAALIENIRQEDLPDGKLYWNIAERTIKPLLEEVHKAVYDAASEIQKQIDSSRNIHLTPIKAEFPEERIRALLNGLMQALEEIEEDGEEEIV